MMMSLKMVGAVSEFVNRLTPSFSSAFQTCVHVTSYRMAHACLGVAVSMFQTLDESRACVDIDAESTTQAKLHEFVDFYWELAKKDGVPLPPETTSGKVVVH